MSESQQRAIVVSSWDRKAIASAHAMAHALGLGDLTTPLIDWRINGGAAFAVLPDGSNVGWAEAEVANQARAAFTRAIRATFTDEDGGTRVEWAHIEFGRAEQAPRFFDDSGAPSRATDAGGVR